MTTKRQKTKSTSVRKRIHRRVKLAVVPHKDNQYRPHAIRRYSLLVLLGIVLLMQFIYNGVTAGNVLGTEAEVTSARLLAVTNQARQDSGAAPLTLNSKLSQAADMKVQDMFAQQYWAHIAPDGTTPWKWFGDVHYSYSEAGENLARNFTTPEGVVSAWLQSPSHRANVLKKDYQDVGFAVREGTLDGHTVTIVVALYGTPSTTAIEGLQSTSQTGASLNILSRIGIGIQSLTPAAVGGVLLLLLATDIALVAHLYRRKMPKHLQQHTLHRHHGAYKATGLLSFVLVMLLLYGSSGQL